ncbi:MAG: hypothetical protein ACK5RR_03100 [Acidobacteriota bacterium]|jgi:hypothetical protein
MDKKDLQKKSAQTAEWFERHLTRRAVGKGMAISAVAGMAGVTLYKFLAKGDDEVTLDSLELQKREGWSVGASERPLIYPAGAVAVDSRQKGWSGYDPSYLISVYQPVSPTWQPFFVPTLLQSLNQPTLSSQIRLFHRGEIAEVYRRAGGLRELIAQTPDAAQTLLVADLPGPMAVAVGAALADKAILVPGFDNWPHPLGVVPSHETLGSMIYYAREIEEKRQQVGEKAPVVLLLDSRRLNEYTDNDNQFDNRWLARVPPVNELKQRGIAKVIYLVEDKKQTTELDDLNETFVDWQSQGLEVRMLPLSDFQLASPSESRLAGGTGAPHYYYGGSSLAHWLFFTHFAMSAPSRMAPLQGGNGFMTRPSLNPASLSSPSGFQPASYRPVSRPTVFASAGVGQTAGVGRIRPSGFGRTSVRVSSNGTITGTRPGRSGSYGRSGGGVSG